MDRKLELLLFKTIEMNKDVSCAEQLGYSYSEIALCFSEMINEGYIDVDKELNYVLSDAGYKYMYDMEEDMRKKGIVSIEPFAKYRIDKMSKYDIFIE